MKRHIMRRLALGLLQHLFACCIMIALAAILFNSYLTVQTMDGPKTYALAPLEAGPVFEDSDLFRDIFQTAVADITRLVVIKGQMETDGEFDPSKLVDVTAYASRKGTNWECPITAVYELEDLIKWGKYGIEHTNRAMSVSDFVNYFGPACSPYNFIVNSKGELQFIGFYDEAFSPEIKWYISDEEPLARTDEELETLQLVMSQYSEEQLEKMAFDYILEGIPDKTLTVSLEDDGSITVYFSMLNGRYETVDRQKQIKAYAGNWMDYMQLQKNVEEAITGLFSAYELYQNSNDLYQRKSNLKYAVRAVAEDGSVQTYTNLEELEEQPDDDITDYFSEFRRFFIYYPESLEFMGNTSLTETDIHAYLSEYDYAYPENTHIWVGVDTSYGVQGDAFYSAHILFENIVPNITGISVTISFLVIVWIVIAVYLTITAGVAHDADGEEHYFLNGFDHIWTEILIGGSVGLYYAARYGYQLLLGIADNVYQNYDSVTLGVTGAKFYEYAAFGAYGAAVSMCLCVIWYSLTRRLRANSFWRDSFIHWLAVTLYRAFHFVLAHHNTAVSTLLPYNAFLLVNLLGCYGIFVLWGKKTIAPLLIVGIVLIDGLVGMLLFKQKSELTDIVDGIKRIRDGEVEYKLDTESMRGRNLEMADAVNNIGDGIHKAVNTSMKDEQMKTDLITNVSHDIKTPLTSIVSYVDLLKRLGIKEEPAKSYIDVLDSKSQRLKQLTDDLVEASKLSSGNIEFQMEKLDLAELINQVAGELSERMEEKGLQIIFDSAMPAAYIYADSRRMWRVMDNLFNNVYKYALENTRVYIDLIEEVQDNVNYVEVSIKNISERQMNIKADDLTERFIRGDSSRTTEGSGLGLYITKNLVQGQNGEFQIQLDGDLFKAVLRFPEYTGQTEGEKAAENAALSASDASKENEVLSESDASPKTDALK